MHLVVAMLLGMSAQADAKPNLFGYSPGGSLAANHDLECREGVCSKPAKFRGHHAVLTVKMEGLKIDTVIVQVSFVHTKKWKKAPPEDVQRIGGNFDDDPDAAAMNFVDNYRTDLEGRRWVKLVDIEASKNTFAVVLQKQQSELHIVVRDFPRSSRSVSIRLMPRDMTPG